MIPYGDEPSFHTQRLTDDRRLVALLTDIETLSQAGSFRSAARRLLDLRLSVEQQMHASDPSLAHRLLRSELSALAEALSQNKAARAARIVRRLFDSLHVPAAEAARPDA